MSKNITDYINGIEPGENVPSISGIICKITPPNDRKETQIIKIQSIDGSDFISLHIKDKSLWLVHPKEREIISLTSGGGGKKAARGLTLRENAKNKVSYITVEQGAVITRTEQEADSVTEIEEEPMTAADSAIDSYVLDRLYIYKRTSNLVKEMKDIMFPPDKIAELATAVHINLERAGISPRPTTAQLERKRVHKKEIVDPKSPAIVPMKQEEQLNWRTFKHPMSGIALGDDPIEKFATFWGPWVLRQDRFRLDGPTGALYDNLVAAIKELKIGVFDMYEAYVTQYALGYEKNNEKKRAAAVKKFEAGLLESGEVKEWPPSKQEAASIIINFKPLWKALVEDEEE